MRTQTMIKLGTVLGASLTALAATLACGGSHEDANTPTNEGAPPSSESNTTAPTGDESSGTDTTGGGATGTGGAGGMGNSATTPPEGYAGSSGSQ